MAIQNSYKYSTCVVFLFVLVTISCNEKKWPDTAILENKYKNNSIIFDSLVAWGFHEAHGDSPEYLRLDSIPKDKQDIFRQLDLKMMLAQHHFCGTYKNGNGSVIFEFNKPSIEKTSSYLMFNQDMTDESRKYISTNGKVTQLNNHWYLIQKNYDWLRE
jgi:hypothetical protein